MILPFFSICRAGSITESTGNDTSFFSICRAGSITESTGNDASFIFSICRTGSITESKMFGYAVFVFVLFFPS